MQCAEDGDMVVGSGNRRGIGRKVPGPVIIDHLQQNAGQHFTDGMMNGAFASWRCMFEGIHSL